MTPTTVALTLPAVLAAALAGATDLALLPWAGLTALAAASALADRRKRLPAR